MSWYGQIRAKYWLKYGQQQIEPASGSRSARRNHEFSKIKGLVRKAEARRPGLPGQGNWYGILGGHLQGRSSPREGSACSKAHHYPAPQDMDKRSMPHDAVGGLPTPVGPGLCRILDMNFGEFPFHALR
jgi:hypothetical protein